MNYWNEEAEKLSLWWNGVSKKELALYGAGSFAVSFFIYLYYHLLGLSGLGEWYRCLRSFSECTLLLFLTQLVTRKNILHPFWRIGCIPFILWITIFPYALIYGRNGLAPDKADFNHISPYFLTAIGVALILFFMMNAISKVVMGKKIATGIVLATSAFFTGSAFFYFLHFELTGLVLGPREIFFAVTHTDAWLDVIVFPRLDGIALFMIALGTIGYLNLTARWIYDSAYRLDKRWIVDTRSYSSIHRILQFVVFIGCAWLLIRWVSECFPVYDFEEIRNAGEYVNLPRRMFP